MSARRHHAYSHPVAKALAATQLRQHLKTVQIAAYQHSTGEDATDYLAHLAWIIGLGCETAANVHGLHHPAMRRLHGALRTVQQLCLRGYRWDEALAPALDAALAEANELIIQHAEVAAPCMPGAEWLASRIRAHQVTTADVAGAELFAQGATA